MDAIERLGELSKGAARGGKYYKRVATGESKRSWRYYYTETEYKRAMGEGAHIDGERAKQAHAETQRTRKLEKMAGTIEALSKKIADGEVPGPLAMQIRLAKKMRTEHQNGLKPLLGKLQSLSSPNAKIKGRAKELESMLGKVVRKPKYKHSGNLQDATGTRVVCGSIREVQETVTRIKANYKVVDEDNYIISPQGDYRSHHLIIIDNGQPKEVQVRTGNQDVWASWFHDMYKPQTPKQEADVRTHKGHLDQYAKQVANFMFAKDQGKATPPPVMPPCTPVVKQTFGCLEAR